jgi:hypothetical protein
MESAALPRLNFKQINARVLSVLNKYGNLMLADCKATVATWNDKPNFLLDKKYRGGRISIEVDTYSEIWWYLNRGTEYRWAVMSNPFWPKTRARSLDSVPGAGGAVLRGRQAMMAHGFKGPMPGIPGRKWDAELLVKHEDNFRRDVTAAIQAGIRAGLFAKGK